MLHSLDAFFGQLRRIEVFQIKEWVEVISHYETSNKYELRAPGGEPIGFAFEDAGGFLRTLLRFRLKSHRPLEIQITGSDNSALVRLRRPFYFFFSSMHVSTAADMPVGMAKKRWGILYKKYDLCTGSDTVFARIRAPIWKLWHFPILDTEGRELGAIRKKWGGFLRESMSDADHFEVDLPPSFNTQQKTVLLASALSIDLDYFEENAGRSNN